MRSPLLVLALVLAAAAPAHAVSTVSRTSETSGITYATTGPANVVLTDAPSGSGVAVTLSEPGIGLGMSAVDCDDNGNSVTCTYADPDDADVSTSLSAMSDTFDAGGLTLSEVSVQDTTGGNDTLTGGQRTIRLSDGFPAGDSLAAGPGSDRIFGGDGNDQISPGRDGGDLAEGGAGDDSVIGIGGPGLGDVLRGGPGRDELYMRQDADPLDPPQHFSIDLGAGVVTDLGGTDAPDVAEGFEDAQTDDGDDVLIGGDGPNLLLSGAGNDRLVGGLGFDLLRAQDGADTLEVRDGFADRADGGPGADICVVDQLDESDECETLDSATVTPFGAVFPDQDPPGCRLRGVKRRPSARRLARRGMVVTATCDEPGRVEAVLTGRLRRLGGTRLARAGDVELARRSARVGATGRARLRLVVARRYRRLLRQGARLRFAVGASDSVGNRAKPLVRRLRLR